MPQRAATTLVAPGAVVRGEAGPWEDRMGVLSPSSRRLSRSNLPQGNHSSTQPGDYAWFAAVSTPCRTSMAPSASPREGSAHDRGSDPRPRGTRPPRRCGVGGGHPRPHDRPRRATGQTASPRKPTRVCRPARLVEHVPRPPGNPARRPPVGVGPRGTGGDGIRAGRRSTRGAPLWPPIWSMWTPTSSRDWCEMGSPSPVCRRAGSPRCTGYLG